MSRFVTIQRMWPTGLCVAEFTTAGADVTADHESSRSFPPAFSHIGATPTAADCVQAVGINYSFGFGVSFVGTDINFQPFGLTYSIRHYKLFKKKLVNRVYKCWRVLPPYIP